MEILEGGSGDPGNKLHTYGKAETYKDLKATFQSYKSSENS